MKRYLIPAIVLSALALTGCEKAAFLDRTPYSTSVPDNFYTDNQSQFKLALTGCYEAINARTVGSGTSVTYGTFYQGLQWVLGCPSDEIVSGSTASPYTFAQATFIESEKCLTQLWSAYYNGIYRCDELLSKLSVYTGSDKAQFEAEARFLKAFYYNHLALVFGGVPLVQYPSDGQEARSSLKDVYTYILGELDYAYGNLEETGLLGSLSANKYTAAAYTARVCNYLAACRRNNVGADLVTEQPLNDFSWVDAAAMSLKARDAAADIIENSGYVLIDSYDRLFRETTKGDQYKECLFMADLPLSGTEGAWPESCRLPAPVGSSVAPQVYGDVLIPNPMHFYLYSNKDPRRDHNFTCGNTGKVADGTVIMESIEGYNYPKPNLKRSTSATWKLLYDSDSQTYNPGVAKCYSAGKFRLVEKLGLQHAVSQHAISYPLMRLADVYLMAAEAEHFVSGDDSKARSEYLRPVLLRAAGRDTTLCDELEAGYRRDDFIDELLESRQRELIFEAQRKTDLIRFGRIDDAIAAMSTTSAVPDRIQELYPTKTFKPYSSIIKGITAVQTNWSHNKIWAPISTAQIAVNRNLTQNAGW